MRQVPIWVEEGRVRKTLEKVNSRQQATLSQFEESQSKPFYSYQANIINTYA